MSLKETFSSVLVSIFGRQLAWRSLLNSNIKLSQLRAVEEMIGHTDADGFKRFFEETSKILITYNHKDWYASRGQYRRVPYYDQEFQDLKEEDAYKPLLSSIILAAGIFREKRAVPLLISLVSQDFINSSVKDDVFWALTSIDDESSRAYILRAHKKPNISLSPEYLKRYSYWVSFFKDHKLSSAEIPVSFLISLLHYEQHYVGPDGDGLPTDVRASVQQIVFDLCKVIGDIGSPPCSMTALLDYISGGWPRGNVHVGINEFALPGYGAKAIQSLIEFHETNSAKDGFFSYIASSALKGLEKIVDPEMYPLFLAALDNRGTSLPVIEVALRKLANGPEGMLEGLLENVSANYKSRPLEWRECVTKTLAVKKIPQVSKFLLDKVGKDTSVDELRFLLQSLKGFKDGTIPGKLKLLLPHDMSGIESAFLELQSEYLGQESLTDLIAGLGAGEATRKACIAAICKLGKSAGGQLIEALDTPECPAKDHIAYCLIAITSKNFGYDVSAWRKWWNETKD